EPAAHEDRYRTGEGWPGAVAVEPLAAIAAEALRKVRRSSPRSVERAHVAAGTWTERVGALQPGARHLQQRLRERAAAARDQTAVGHHHEKRMLVCCVLIADVLGDVRLRLAFERRREI